MNLFRKSWNSDEGGVDFMQLVVGLMIISIAAVGTFQALIYGYGQLDYEMRYRKAVSIARSYVEYWQGRVHTDFASANRQVRNGNLTRPETKLLDERDPSIEYDNIHCQVAYGPIQEIDLQTTGIGVDHYKIRVYVTWWEPSETPGRRPPHEIFFDATMVPAAL